MQFRKNYDSNGLVLDSTIENIKGFYEGLSGAFDTVYIDSSSDNELFYNIPFNKIGLIEIPFIKFIDSLKKEY